MENKISECLNQTFKMSDFKHNQLDIIKTTMSNIDCLVLMPTGGGKSLCYQLPAVISNGVTIVVSPLKSLIIDQVDKLKILQVAVAYINSDLSKSEIDNVLHELTVSPPKLLYVTPERIISPEFQAVLSQLKNTNQLSRFVIDEAHCIIEWGDDFRESYSKLDFMKTNFPTVSFS